MIYKKTFTVIYLCTYLPIYCYFTLRIVQLDIYYLGFNTVQVCSRSGSPPP